MEAQSAVEAREDPDPAPELKQGTGEWERPGAPGGMRVGGILSRSDRVRGG